MNLLSEMCLLPAQTHLACPTHHPWSHCPLWSALLPGLPAHALVFPALASIHTSNHKLLSWNPGDSGMSMCPWRLLNGGRDS